ncbi:MAG: hypothetical protein ABW168_11585, partial [Sedimenticola sp.]
TPNDLVGELPGGQKFILTDYLVLVKATDGALPPPLTLNDGVVIDGAEVMAALAEVDLDLVGDTAAGGQAGPNAIGNAGFSTYFPEELGGGLQAGLGGDQPGGLGDALSHPNGGLGDPGGLGGIPTGGGLFAQFTQGTLDIEVSTGIEISGYENALPNQHLGDTTLLPANLMKVNIAMEPSNEATYRDSLTFNDIPDGATLYVRGIDVSGDIIGNSYTIELLALSVAEQEALLDAVYMIAPEDSGVDFLLTAEAVFGGPSGNLTVLAETLVIVDAVAEKAVIDVPASDEYDEDGNDGQPDGQNPATNALSIPLTGTVTTQDIDGSEDVSKITIELTGLPAGSVISGSGSVLIDAIGTISAGTTVTFQGFNYSDGTIDTTGAGTPFTAVFTGVESGRLVFEPVSGSTFGFDAVVIDGAIVIDPPHHWHGQFGVTVDASSMDFDYDADLTQDNDLAEADAVSYTVNVKSINDKPVVEDIGDATPESVDPTVPADADVLTTYTDTINGGDADLNDSHALSLVDIEAANVPAGSDIVTVSGSDVAYTSTDVTIPNI